MLTSINAINLKKKKMDIELQIIGYLRNELSKTFQMNLLQNAYHMHERIQLKFQFQIF